MAYCNGRMVSFLYTTKHVLLKVRLNVYKKILLSFQELWKDLVQVSLNQLWYLFSLFLSYLDYQLVFQTFFFGDWQYGLITGAILWSVGGTAFLILLGWLLRLVGVEYDLQKKEALSIEKYLLSQKMIIQ